MAVLCLTKSQVPPHYILWTRRRYLSFYLICVTRKSCPTGCPCFFYKGQAHIDMFNKWCLLGIVVINWLSHDNLQFVDKAPSDLDLYYLPVKRPIYSQTLFHFAPHIAFQYVFPLKLIYGNCILTNKYFLRSIRCQVETSQAKSAWQETSRRAVAHVMHQ